MTASKKQVLIVGYGVAGKSLARSLSRTDEINVVGFLDDAEEGDRVLGTLREVNEVLNKHKVTDVYIAIPSAPARTIRNFLNEIEDEEVKISMIPRSVNILAKETVNIHDLTDVDVLSLVGRKPVKHDILQCRELIAGKTIIVTGAAGSIGSKLVELLATLDAKEIVCVDWWENGTFRLQQKLNDKKQITYRIADIKDTAAMEVIFKEFKPELLFHAAAFKHVPLMQGNPNEAVNNNIWGSMNLMQLAIKHKLSDFVLVSTDKAVNPANVMGACKRLAEMTMETMAASQKKTKFTAVRFGNVIQSNGSVMEVFKRQIANNEPVTVTDKGITRFFMTIEEAAQLIIQSVFLGKNGEIFVLDMGEPIKVYDLARSLIRLSNSSSEIQITGLRPGEKMYEELSYDDDSVNTTRHDKIFVVKDEKPFEHDEFLKNLDALLKKSRAHNMNAEEAIETIKSFGFKIKK